MTPTELLSHIDDARLWPCVSGAVAEGDLDKAYQLALQVRDLRQARGERPAGIKIGFTNRTIWPVYNVHAPIWGTVWDTTVHEMPASGLAIASLDRLCQPRIEPEVVFALKKNLAATPSMDDLFDAIDWLAPGFELVQSHLPDWKFAIADTAADSGLHGQLWIGPRTSIAEFAADADTLASRLAASQVELFCDDTLKHVGLGANVLDSPLHALRHVVDVLSKCPGAPVLKAGDVITTGTWTDAPPVETGQTWKAVFDWAAHPISLAFR